MLESFNRVSGSGNRANIEDSRIMSNKNDIDRKASAAYSPAEVEDRLYSGWLDLGMFHGDPTADRKRYSVVIPPPNVTAILQALDSELGAKLRD